MKNVKVPLRLKIPGAFVVSIVLLSFVHMLDYRASEEMIAAFGQVETLQENQFRLVEIGSLLKDVQRAQRGFVITGKHEFLEPYTHARERLPGLLIALEQRWLHQPAQLKNFREFEVLTADIIAYANQVILQRQQGQVQPVAQVLQGKNLFDQLIGLQARMLQREQQQLQALRQQAEQKSDKNQKVVIIAFVVSIFLLLLALWRIALNLKDIAQLQRRLEDSNQELAANNEELLTTNQVLSENERKLTHLNQELDEGNKALEKMSAELGTFSYSISHDLRAPLRAISGYSTILKEEYAQQLNEEGRQLLEIIGLNANRMGTLIHDLLNFSKLGKKAIHKQSYDMQVLVMQVLEAAAVREGTIINVDPLEPALIDPVLFRQVWENLLSNALKFSREQSRPEISIRYRREEQRQVFCVSDNGVGFDPDYAQDLFQVFKRLHADAAFEGSGAGLAIAKRIVEGHGGEIWASAKPNQGATFCFSLPLEVS